MKIDKTEMKGVTVIALGGRFDAGRVGYFKEYTSQLSLAAPAYFVVDMSEVNYIDSGGLGCLVSFLRQVRQNEGDVKVSMLNDKVRNVFELTRLYRIFEIYDHTHVAVSSYSNTLPIGGGDGVYSENISNA